MGFVGSSINSRIAHIFSKSSRKWCEKTASEPTKINQGVQMDALICIYCYGMTSLAALSLRFRLM